MDSQPDYVVDVFFLIHWMLAIVVTLRIIMRRNSVGVALAWLTLVFFLPMAGSILYIIFGEISVGRARTRRALQLIQPFKQLINDRQKRFTLDWSQQSEASRLLARHAYNTTNLPTLPGNDLELLDNCQDILRRMIDDIQQATHRVHMEFYIWHLGGIADEVMAAVIEARKRGAHCRILLDSIGSHDFLKSELCKKARQAGVEIAEALPVRWLRNFYRRQDLRLHRKIVCIDGEIAYTGSLNLVDSRHFKTKAGVGQWVDSMVRVKGPVVEALAVVFLADWSIETGMSFDQITEEGGLKELDEAGESFVQVVPSGPGFFNQSSYQSILTAIYLAKKELVLTTPYFVPDEAVQIALVSAVMRGVNVTLIMPEKVDSKLVHHASRAYFEELLEGGVRIALFTGGLLHSKTVTVDNEIGLIGSVNLDQRSLWLNQEVTLFVYDSEFAQRLRKVQQSYIDNADILHLAAWKKRRFHQRLLENALRLTGPLL
ncbi:cardiolipin synthase [Ruficoccus sp. ZRK36]|uniref:cardiolipin synthase n=1 Tax=Ruficoccus sp. ZRK36 TaxID=2866311 RepID=UPI001C73D152|nr:cardiolipin synthase [Ruficoccus sp. ZRK36]QYY36020.1 cardiolipin synthase [Ruficoccus sp. ZRK36]